MDDEQIRQTIKSAASPQSKPIEAFLAVDIECLHSEDLRLQPLGALCGPISSAYLDGKPPLHWDATLKSFMRPNRICHYVREEVFTTGANSREMSLFTTSVKEGAPLVFPRPNGCLLLASFANQPFFNLSSFKHLYHYHHDSESICIYR